MNVWWCNQTRCWQEESEAGVVRASDHMKRLTYRQTVNDVRKGDVIIHYRKPYVYAVSVAKSSGKYSSNLPPGYGSGWEFKTAYHLLNTPVHRTEIRDKLANYSDKHYAISSNGWVKQGYFLPFDIRGLKIVRASIPAAQRPEWLPSFR